MWRARRGWTRPHLLQLVHRGAVDLLLRVEAGAHHPLVGEVEQAAALVEAQGLGVRQEVERLLERHAHLQQAVLGRPRPVHRLLVRRERLRVRGDERGRDVVGPARVGERHERARGRHHAVPLVLAVGGVGELLQERVGGVVHRPPERGVHRELQRLQAVAVEAGVEEPLERRVVAERGGRGARAPPAPPRPSSPPRAPCSPRAATRARRAARRAAPPRRRRPPRAAAGAPRPPRPRRAAPGRCARRTRGRCSFTRPTMASTTARVSGGRVARAHHAVQAVQHDARHRVDHRGEGGDGDDVARRLDRLLLRLALDLLPPLVRGVRRQVPQVGQDPQRVLPQQLGQPAVALPRRLDRALVDRARLAATAPPAPAPAPRRAGRSAARTARSCRRGASAGTTTRTAGSRSRARTRSARAARRCGARPRR